MNVTLVNRFGRRKMAATVLNADSVARKSAASKDPKSNPYPMVHVVWADAHAGEGGWIDLGEYDDDGECLVETVGFLVPSTDPGGKKNHITVWQTYAGGEAINPFHIPAGMVRKLQVINPAD